MDFDFQSKAVSELQKLAYANHHSILISGIRGSGKTYLAQKFAQLKGIDNFHCINPKVADLKDTVQSSFKLQENQVICIENLDDGKPAASQVILKYLEEPLPTVYIVVTCVNASKLPDTILSRAIEVKVGIPHVNELAQYARNFNAQKFTSYKDYVAFSTCKSFSDIRQVLNLSLDQVKYYEKFRNIRELFKQPVDSILWCLGHYEDNSKLDSRLALRCVLSCSENFPGIQKIALDSLLALEDGKLSETAILGKFVLDGKYS